MRVRKIKSKKVKLLIRNDVIFFIFCFVIANIRMLLQEHTNVIIVATQDFIIFKNINVLLGIISFLVSILLNTIKKSILFIIIYISYRISKQKVINQNKKYEVIDNMEYYREEFIELSLAEMSLIADLEIEVKKDISATLLKLYMLGYISFDNEKINVVQRPEPNSVKPSEMYLLESISDGNLNMDETQKWKDICVEECINDGYITNRKRKEHKHFWVSTILWIASFIFLIQSVYFFISINIDDYDKIISKKIQQIEFHDDDKIMENRINTNEDIEIKEFLLKNPDFLKKLSPYIDDILRIAEVKIALLEIFGFLISLFLIITIPIYKFFRKMAFHSIENTNQYDRTWKGKVLAEQIAALQRYIHDFSLLSEREKEEVKIWNEFLSYAIILEENEKIVDEIYKYKNIKKIKIF